MNTARVSRNFSGGQGAATRKQLPTAGVVHAGIKVLTAKAAGVQGAREIYDAGLESGKSFDAIGAEIAAIKGAPQYPLAPKNAPYFTVRQEDFKVPGAAAKIMEMYAEQRGDDPTPRLYSLPIIFPSDDMDLVFHESFESWKASEKFRWSEEGENGELNCMKQAPIKVVDGVKRRHGPPPPVVDRLCDPNDCPLFNDGLCNHIGSLFFWIPGIEGIGTIRLTLRSIYAKLSWSDAIMAVHAGLGRISGLHNGKPIFSLVKSLERISRINYEQGKREKVNHYIVRLEATGINMMDVLAGANAQPQIGSSDPVLRLPHDTPVFDERPTDEDVAATEAASAEAEPANDNGVDVRALRKRLAALRDEMKWSTDDLAAWLVAQFGDTAVMRDPEQLPKVVDALAERVASLDSDVPF